MVKPDKKLIYPLFIPMQGCSGTCVYCDQRKISGAAEFDLQRAKAELKLFIRHNSGKSKEVAFYGGTFTALEPQIQKQYLLAVSELLEQTDSIRISTHPLHTEDSTLSLLKEHRVKTIELGIQDFADSVLQQSGRAYTGKMALNAAQRVRDWGFQLGLQLMPGLPGSNMDTLQITQQTLLVLAPEIMRLYPAVVIRGTRLEKMYEEGSFLPLSIPEAVRICADYSELCARHGIRIIKYGLPSNLEPQDFVAGPYHPAFGELVKQEILRREIVGNPEKRERLQPREIQLLRAHGGVNY
jgi:histone acetyltransferase (RNA polymerase elongator complex component)